MNDSDDFHQAIRDERRRARAAARLFADAVKAGDVDRLYEGADAITDECDAWLPAMRMVAKLPPAPPAIREAFLRMWIESKGLGLRTGDRRSLANGLRVLLPCDYQGPPLRLWRGTTAGERRRRLYGFSWTTDLDIARRFADPHTEQLRALLERGVPMDAALSSGIVLETTAPPDAIMLVREAEGYYDESEVVVDPFRLGAVRVAEGRG
jgi:hypothetical protein